MKIKFKWLYLSLTLICVAAFASIKISEENKVYLQNSVTKSTNTFLTLSAVKGAVAVIEGSTIGAEVGVTADLQVGDAVQPIYDFIDLAWKLSLSSVTVLLLINAIITFAQSTGLFVLVATLIFSGFYFYFRNRANCKALAIITRFLVTLSLSVYIVLPISIGCARVMSEKISTPLIEQGEQDFEKLKIETSQSEIQSKYFDDVSKIEGVWKTKERIDVAKQKLIEFSVWCKKRTEVLVENGIRYCAGICFDCFIFPLAIALVIYSIFKFGLNSNRDFKDELREVINEIKRLK